MIVVHLSQATCPFFVWKSFVANKRLIGILQHLADYKNKELLDLLVQKFQDKVYLNLSNSYYILHQHEQLQVYYPGAAPSGT